MHVVTAACRAGSHVLLVRGDDHGGGLHDSVRRRRRVSHRLLHVRLLRVSLLLLLLLSVSLRRLLRGVIRHLRIRSSLRLLTHGGKATGKAEGERVESEINSRRSSEYSSREAALAWIAVAAASSLRALRARPVSYTHLTLPTT